MTKNNISKVKFLIKILIPALFFLAMPIFASASGVVVDKKETIGQKSHLIDNSWKKQKNNIIKNIKKEIYLNNFLIDENLKKEIKEIKVINVKKDFITSVKEIYSKLDVYYINNRKYNIDFRDLRNEIIEKIEQFSKIDNVRINNDFNNDLIVLKKINSQKLFLAKVESFFDKHIKDFSLRSVKKKIKVNAENKLEKSIIIDDTVKKEIEVKGV